MITQLSLELVGHTVDRGRHVVGLGVRPEGLPRDVQRRLDPLDTVGPRVVLADELQIDAGGARLHALERSELVAGGLPHLVGDREPSARERQVHALVRRSCSVGRALRRLTWSFPPHPPAGAFAGARLRPDSRPLSPGGGAGLTSKPRHAQRPRVALRGSFRPRLASTTGDGPRATTDPDEGPDEYRHVGPSRRSARAATTSDHLRRAALEQHLGAGGRGRPGREHVVDEQHVSGDGRPIAHGERATHRGTPRRPRLAWPAVLDESRRRRSLRAGRPSSRPTTTARTPAWSNPRSPSVAG